MKHVFYWLICMAFISCSSPTLSNSTKSEEVSLEHMIGQMIMIGFRGITIDEVSTEVKEHLKNERIGGILLFDYDVIKKEAVRNIQSPQQLKKLIHDLKSLSNSPLLMAVDQEGGRVNRLKAKYGFPASVSNQYLGEINNADSTRFYASQNAKTLKDLGFNVNFAPVVDININTENPVIGKIERSYSTNIDIVEEQAREWINEHAKLGIISTLKHFPGHGSSHDDSHYGMTDITEYWTEKELKPFQTLTDLDNVALMTAHVVNRSLDTFPATLSEKVIKKIVRDEWKFDGLIFSDDLHMAAVNALYDFDIILERSIEAGIDILVFGNNLKYDESIPKKVIPTVVDLVKSGRLDENLIVSSYERIMKVKNQVQ